jgi:hypothetical protein
MNRSYNKIRHIQETNQKLENRVLNEQVNPRIQALLNYLKKFAFTPQEIQQAQVALKAPQAATKPAAPAKPSAPQQPKKIGGLDASYFDLNPTGGGM